MNTGQGSGICRGIFFATSLMLWFKNGVLPLRDPASLTGLLVKYS